MANQSTSSGGKRASVAGLILFGIFWTLFSSVFVCIGLWITWKGASQSLWKKTPCVIERFEIQHDLKKSPVFREDLRFRYDWEGRSYTGTRLRPDSEGDDQYETLSKARESLLAEAGRDTPDGLRTECRVDPEHPETASLLGPSGGSWFGLIFAAFGGGFVLIGLSMIVSAIRNRHKTALSDQSAKNQAAPFSVTIFFGLFTLIGLGATAGLVVPKATHYFAARSWIETPATIVWSRVKSHSGSKGSTTYSADLFYRYSFKGREYFSNRYSHFTGSSSDRDAAEDMVRTHPAGTSLTCHVNPEKPWEAVVKRNPGAGALFALFPLPFLAVGIGGLIWNFRRKRAERSGKAGSSNQPSGLLPQRAVQDLPERVLHSGKSRWLNLFGALFVCAFWNGIVSVFVGIAWTAWKKGKPEVFLMIFLIPFVVIGLFLLVNFAYQLLLVFLARHELRLTPGTLKPGGAATLTWRRVGGFGQPKSLTLRLIGMETTTRQNGKNTARNFSCFHDEVVATLSPLTLSTNRPIAIRLPENAPPSFNGGSNKIIWKLRLETTLPGLPSLQDELEFDVRPPHPEELNR